jgi:hypothetical protein
MIQKVWSFTLVKLSYSLCRTIHVRCKVEATVEATADCTDSSLPCLRI